MIGSMLLIAGVVPAFAEKVTLGCALGPEYHVMYYTFDMGAKTVKDANPVEGGCSFRNFRPSTSHEVDT